jgi:hypothetical protein
MVDNIEGGGNLGPGAYSKTETISSGVSVPTNGRIPVIMGEGLSEEIIVGSANGNGNDGFDSTFSTTAGANGRYFLLGNYPVITNRSSLYKNGVLLSLTEGNIGDTFTTDALIDITTGQIELQPASLVDQGGLYYLSNVNNVGTGIINNLTLQDVNAPTETWTIRCSSIRRDSFGNAVDGYARFVARGSESGTLLDGYGNQIVWQSNGSVVTNSVLQFSISEGGIKFQEGDSFVIQVSGGALVSGDQLSAKYIPTINIEDPEYFTDLNALYKKHGQPSETNTLSLGAQLAWANGTPGVYAIQTKPAIPRRVSYVLNSSANGEADLEDLIFELPIGITPDADSNINFFITNPITRVETQIIPNKVEFNTFTLTNADSFVNGGTYEYSYTVVEGTSVQKTGLDGVLTVTSGTTATLASETVVFGLDDLAITRTVLIENSTGNNGTFTITGVSQGRLLLSGVFTTSETNVEFKVLDSVGTSSRILFTVDLALSLGESLRATIVDYKDADFFDAGWIDALNSARAIDVDIVVPLPTQTISTIFQNAKIHVETMSNVRNRKERVLFVGGISGLLPENVIGTRDAAVEDIGVLEGIQGDSVSEILDGNIEDLANYTVQDSFGDSYRCVYFYPDEIVVNAGGSNITVDGLFIGAAAAGYLAGSTLIQEPITFKKLGGFSINRSRRFDPIIENQIMAKGICLLTPVSGGGKVLWGKTTTNSFEANEEELSVVFIRDAISKQTRLSFNPFIGRSETGTTKSTLFEVAQSSMKSAVSKKWITRFANLTVQRDKVEPRQWNVTVAIQPVQAINWVWIVFSVGILE